MPSGPVAIGKGKHICGAGENHFTAGYFSRGKELGKQVLQHDGRKTRCVGGKDNKEGRIAEYIAHQLQSFNKVGLDFV